jgi:hypothetical protein
MDVLTTASKISRNLNALTLADQKAVLDFVQRGVEQKIADEIKRAGGTAAPKEKAAEGAEL